MNFVFNIQNHTPLGQRSLEDPMTILTHQLRALGHAVQRLDGKGPVDGGITVCFEGWVDEGAEEPAAAFKRAGGRLLIIATEQPTDKGMNHGVGGEQFVKRQEVFPLIAQHAEAIWCLVPGTATWYGQFGPPAVDVELGWAETLQRRGNDPDAEFCFFGNLTGRRRKILERLVKRTQGDMRKHGNWKPFTAVRCTYFGEGGQRDSIVTSGKVLPLIRAHEPMGLVSSSRISTTLHLGRPVIAEPHELCQNWEGVVDFAKDTEDFYRRAIDARHGWRALHARQMKAFREAMSPEQQVGRALRVCGL